MKNNSLSPGNVRGDVLTFSASSRLNLMRQLATIRVSAVCHTMALTLPGSCEHISRPMAKLAFLRLNKQFTAKVQKSTVFQGIGYFWKQELQKRGALHFHLLLWGVKPSDIATVQGWVSELWNKLLFAIPGGVPEDKSKHLWWHMRPENFQEVRDMHGYFAKYLGKDDKESIAESVIPGRWWGKTNKNAIPFVEGQELALPARVAVHAQRVARKIREKRAQAGKHAATCHAAGALDLDRKPMVSQFGLLRGTVQGQVAKILAAENGVRFGKAKLPRAMKFSKVVLVGADAPALSLRILQYAGARALEDKENTPF